MSGVVRSLFRIMGWVMATPEELSALGNNAGGWTLGILSALGAARFAWLRLSKDRIALAGDAADLNAITRLQKRVDDLDERLRIEEALKHKIMGLLMRVMAVTSSCPGTKNQLACAALMDEYKELMDELAEKK